MNNFLRAQFKHFSVDPIKNRMRKGVGILCGMVALVAFLSPVGALAIGFAGATISPTFSSPQLVCSGGQATITLTPSTCVLGGPDWSATYFIDSSNDGGSTWFTPVGVTTGTVTAASPIVTYTSPVLINLTPACYDRTYRIRLTGIISHCLGNTTYTSPLSRVTVCRQPDPITGLTSLCIGQTITLATTSTGGTWSSSDGLVASVGTGGVVSGLSQGTSTISYTFSGGCSSTRVVTVNALPAPIVGPTTVCLGATATYSLSAAPFTGTWSSSNLAAGTIDPATGVFTSLGGGATTITNTNAAGCTSNLVVTSSPLPTSFSVVGGGSYCAGGSGVSITLSGSSAGVNYQLYNGAATVGSALAGTGGPLFFGSFTTVGTYTVLATNTTSGCTNAMTGSATITVNPSPSPVSGPTTVCVGATASYATASTGGTWSSSDIVVGTIDGVSGSFTALTAGTTIISYTFSTGCAATMTVTVSAAAGPISGALSLCAGTTSTLTATPAGGNWISSNGAVATVGITTGVVTGVSNGTANITYTLAGGCRSITTVTVNTVPAPITGGPLTLCDGATATFTTASVGGTWISSATSTITIAPVAGIATGQSVAGTALISYVLGGGCASTITVTVLATPTTITGPDTVCLGATITKANGMPGGIWTSANSTIASVVAGTGVVTGVALGATSIRYTLPGGCFVTDTITVSDVPAPITGVLNLCVGQSTVLSSTSAGGVWSVSNFAIDTIESATGLLTARSPGTDIVRYTLPSGCSASAVVTVNALPAAITGPTGVCMGATITLSSSPAGGTWTSNIPPTADVDITTGVVTGFFPGIVTITYALPTGCTISTPITVNPTPLPNGGSHLICVGSISPLSNPSAGGPGTWISSNPSIAAINSTTGVVNGFAPGTATITYTLPTGCFTTSVVTVNPLPAPITGFARTCIGFCTTLSNTTPGGTWSSLDIAVATIGTSGSLCGVTPGTAIISYTLPTGCATSVIATVDPIPGPPTGVLGICVGGTTTLSHPIPGGTWSSSDTIVAKVFLGTGLVTGFTAGTANITYTLASGCTAFATVTVSPVPPATTGTLYMCEGNTTTLFNLFPGGAWTSATPSVATVDAAGVVTGVSAGTAEISYTLPSGCARSAIVTVYPLPAIIGSVLVCPGIASTLTGSPAGGLWASSPTIIATIGSLSGVVTGINTGTATITYTLATTCRNTAVVTVQPLPAAITGPTQVCVGSTITLINLTTGGGTWSSSLPAIGSIDATTGVVTGLTAGVTIITFTANATGCIITTPITVNPLPAAVTGPTNVCVGSTISISSASGGGTWSSSGVFASVGSATGIVTGVSAGVEVITYILPTGCLTTYSVTVDPLPAPITGSLAICYSYTTFLSSGTPGGIWSISPTSVATIDASGLVTAVWTGSTAATATVTYTLPTTGCLTTAIVTVNPLPDTITGLLNICLNDSTTLFNSVPGGSWSSENILIAVVNPTSGLVASVSAGTVHITYTLPTGCYRTAIMTINPTPQPITGTLSVCQGFTSTLSNITTGGSWSSSDLTVASVGTATGVVLGVSPGVAFITYTLPSSCPRVVQFTVNPNPAPITGTTSICQGDTSILSSTTPGGTWSSSNPGVAFIFMPSGQMIGLTTGTSIITYMLPTGCFAATTVIVNPVPTDASILGNRVLCVGTTSTLSNTIFPGGTWSSSNVGVVTIGVGPGGPSAGTMFGVSAGTARITYVLPTGCDTFITVTVNPLPAVITGNLSVCEGDNSALSSATPGGTWSSSNPTVGTINATTGVFTGLVPGLTVITYKLTSTGCERTALLTVNPLPNPIVGVTDICLGSDTILTSGPGGGAWSGGGFVATVVAISPTFDVARITGIGVGTTTITYTLPTGCFRTVTVEVHPLPAPIVGPDTVCEGSTIVLTSVPLPPSSGAGTWTSSDPLVATIDPFTGVLTGVAPGVVTITYSLAFSCYETFRVTVNPLPAAIVAPVNLCVGFVDTARNVTTGGSWSISDPGIATIVDTSGVITGVSAGTATITYTLPTSCFVTRIINIRPLPVVVVNHPTVICKYSSVVLTASGADGGYTWSPSTGLNTTVGPVVTASPTITTTYVVTGTTTFGCPDTAQVTVIVDTLLNDIRVTGRDSICKGDCTVLIASGREGTFFNWRPAAGLSCTICDTVTACPIVTTPYTMVAIDSLGCRDSIVFTVTVMQLPVMRVLPNPAIVCNGSTTQLTVRDSLATAGYVTKFAWFPNAFISCDTCFNPVLSNTFNLVYRVTGITPFGCHDSLRVPVTVLDSAFNSINKDTVICLGGSAQLNAISFNPDGARSDFFWLNDVAISNRFIPNPVVSPVVTTTYSVAITPNVCWPDTLYTTVVVAPFPDIDITVTPADATVQSGTSVPLKATVSNGLIISNYFWSPPGSLSCVECYNTVATPSVTTTYTFTATSVYGCTSTKDVTIKLTCDDAQVFIPNTFTPNGDGMNDRFYVSGKGISNISKFLIYNRWGELVYERYNIQANDAGAGWDGQYKGVVLPPDVFVYIVEATCNLGGTEFKYKGDISIVR